jgi:hypothetical protein
MDPVDCAIAAPPAIRSAAFPGADTCALSSHPFPLSLPPFLDFPMYSPTQITSEPACQ